MQVFATVEALEQRWRTLTDTEKSRAEALLSDASAILATLLASHGIDIDTDDEMQMTILEVVCCNMVQRVMSVSDDLAGVKQYSQTAGSYTGIYTFSNSGGDMYLLANELKWLGIKRQRMGVIRPAIHDRAGDEIAGW